MSNVINIKELDPDMIKPSMEDVLNPRYDGGGSKITVIGKPGTGKTKLITSLIYDKRACFPTGMVISGTEDSNHYWQNIFGNTFVHNKYKPETVKNFIKRQKISKQYLTQPWALLLLDDCTDDPKIFHTPLMQGLYKNGRHWVLFYILSLQYCMDVKPVIRNNIDGTFILREPNIRSRKSIYENYAGIIPTFKLFCHIMNEITDDYTALYIHNNTQTNDWKDCVFWYRAYSIPDDFKIGSFYFRDFHKQRYNEKYKEIFEI